MFTVMYWRNKHELRVINLNGIPIDSRSVAEFFYLPEHKANPPRFQTAEEGWEYIEQNYPHLHP